MSRIFRRKRQGKKDAKYTVEWKEDGKVRRKIAYKDKQSSNQVLAKLEKKVAQGETGLVDPFQEHNAKPLTEHLEEFRVSLVSNRRSPKYIKLICGRLKKAIGQMKATRLKDLEQSKADRFLSNLKGSASTRDHYAGAMKQFGSWLRRLRRVPHNPFLDLQRVGTEAQITFERRPLSSAEIQQLAHASATRPAKAYLTTHPNAKPETLAGLKRRGERRALTYFMAAYTGLRYSECRGLRWCDLDLDTPTPALVVEAHIAKSKRRDRVPLASWLAQRLRDERKAMAIDLGRPVGDQDLVLYVPSNNRLLEQLRKDAEWAGIGLKDGHGRRLDFHSFRASCATLLALAGVTPKETMRIMRHTDVRLTLMVYTKLGLFEDLSQAVEKMPGPKE